MNKRILVVVVLAVVVMGGVASGAPEGWSDDVRLTNNASGSAYPAIAPSGNNLHVVWEDDRDGNMEIYYKNSTDIGVSWNGDVRLTNAVNDSNMPAIAANGSNLHIVWYDFRDGNSEIYYKNSTNGGATWSSDVRLTNDLGSSGFPSMAVNGNNIHVVWTDSRVGNLEIYYKNSTDNGATWSSDMRLTNDVSESYTFMPQAIAVNGNNIHVVWYDNRDGNFEIYYKNSTDNGATWGSDMRLTNNASWSQEPAIAVSGTNIQVVWRDGRDGANGEIYYKNSTDNGATWSADVRLTNDASESAYPAIALNGSYIHVVWADWRDGDQEIYYKNSTDNGATWSSDMRLTNAAGGSIYPDIAVNGSSIHVVWGDSRDGNYEIYYKRSPPFPPPAITSWGNTKTNNASLNVTVSISEQITFNATANQTITNWNWFKDGLNQSWNYYNITLNWDTNGSKTVQVNATNANGMSNTIQWNVTVLDVTPPVITNVTNSTVNVSGNSPKTFVT